MRKLLVAVVVLIGCGDSAATDHRDVGTTGAPIDAGAGVVPDATVDAAPPPDPGVLCGAAPVTLDDWEDCYQRRWCETAVACGISNPYLDVKECLDRSDDLWQGQLSAERRARRRAVAADRAAVDPDAFARCLADLSPDRCATAGTSAACKTRFAGTIADGDTCYTDIDCASPGATCDAACGDSSCCAGTCHPKLKAGEACDVFGSCEPGLVCDYTCKSGDVDSACSDSSDCDADAWCDRGTCVPDYPEGAACTQLAQCGGTTTCIGLSLVDATPGHCLDISTAGDACDLMCYGNLYCDATGRCRALPAVGDACSLFVPCRGVDTFCDTKGQCVVAASKTERCGDDRPCRAGLFCTSELGADAPTCVPPRAAGADCAAPSHCASYACSGDSAKPGTCLGWQETCSPDGD